MNKKYFSAFFLIAFSLQLVPYKNIAQQFNAGIIAGLSTSQVDGDHIQGFNKVGIKAGGFVNRKISDKFSMQFELEFIQKGSRNPVNPDNNTFYLLRLNYVEAPLMFSYWFNKKWNIEVGPSIAVLVSSYEEDETGISFPTYNEPEFNRFDYLGSAGINYLISEDVWINVRYSYSIVPMREYESGYSYFYFSGNQYNNVLAFTMAFQF